MALPVVTHPVRCLPTEMTKTARPLTIINSAFKRSSQLSWAAFFEVPFEKRPSFASSLETFCLQNFEINSDLLPLVIQTLIGVVFVNQRHRGESQQAQETFTNVRRRGETR